MPEEAGILLSQLWFGTADGGCGQDGVPLR
jgi:hypothetical protein